MKSFSFNIKNKILKEINYNSKNFIIYDYERIKRKTLNTYAYKEKRRRYIEIINLKYIKFKKEYLNIII